MSKFMNDAVMDAALDKWGTGTILTVCSAQPTNRTEAVSTYALADVTLTGGSFTKSDGDVSGRKSRISQQSNIPIDFSGSATHVAVCDGTILLGCTTCTAQTLTAGGTVTVPAFDYEVLDVA